VLINEKNELADRVEKAGSLDELARIGNEAMTALASEGQSIGGDRAALALAATNLWRATEWVGAIGRPCVRTIFRAWTEKELLHEQMRVARAWILVLAQSETLDELEKHVKEMDDDLSRKLIPEHKKDTQGEKIQRPDASGWPSLSVQQLFLGEASVALAKLTGDRYRDPLKLDRWTPFGARGLDLGRLDPLQKNAEINRQLVAFKEDARLANAPIEELRGLVEKNDEKAESLHFHKKECDDIAIGMVSRNFAEYPKQAKTMIEAIQRIEEEERARSPQQKTTNPGQNLADRFGFSRVTFSPMFGLRWAKGCEKVAVEGFEALARSKGIPERAMSLGGMGIGLCSIADAHSLGAFGPRGGGVLSLGVPPVAIAHEWTHALEGRIVNACESGAEIEMARKALRELRSGIDAAFEKKTPNASSGGQGNPSETNREPSRGVRKATKSASLADLGRVIGRDTVGVVAPARWTELKMDYWSDVAKNEANNIGLAISEANRETDKTCQKWRKEIEAIGAAANAGADAKSLKNQATDLAESIAKESGVDPIGARAVESAKNLARIFAFCVARPDWGPFQLEAARVDAVRGGDYWQRTTEKLARASEARQQNIGMPQLEPLEMGLNGWLWPKGEELSAFEPAGRAFEAQTLPFLKKLDDAPAWRLAKQRSERAQSGGGEPEKKARPQM
jgi:hypothetical protein